MYIIGNADAKAEARICFIIAGAWAVVSVFYVLLTSVQKTYRVKVVTCVIRPEQLGDVAAALKREELVVGMTVTDVRGFGRQKGETEDDLPVHEETIRFQPKVKIEVLVRDWDVNKTMQVITSAVRTGNIGDGKIIVFDASSAMRIRTGEKGVYAL